MLLPSERNPASIERANLLIVCKLVVKEVIGSSLKHGRMLDDEHAPLQQFFVVLEHVLRHRIKRMFLHVKHDLRNICNRFNKEYMPSTELSLIIRLGI